MADSLHSRLTALGKLADRESLPAEVRDELTAAAGQALALSERLEALQRRERELSALYDTARDLAALRDLDTLLTAIVRRARGLLGTDVAYMTLVDPERGDTGMRVTDGSVSAWFQNLRLSLGAGLGGLVADRGQPYATASYLSDPRFRHTTDIDGAVVEEGLVAILGVPLVLGPASPGEVIGVLFAANRTERPFAHEEIALLGSLAALAAVAIDTAGLLAETGHRLRERDAANAVIQDHSAAVERAADAHDRLAAVVLGGGGVGDLATAVADILGGSLLVRDADGRVLASVGEFAELPAELSGPPRLHSATRARRVADTWVVAATAGDEVLGDLVLGGLGALDAPRVRTVERAAVVTALLLLVRRSAATAEEQVRGELLTDLLTDRDRDPAALADRARRVGVDLAAAHCVVVAAPRDGCVPRPRLAATAARHARGLGGLGAEHGGAAVLLLPGDAPGDAARAVARDLAAALHVPVTAGGAGPATSACRIPDAHAEAAQCRGALDALGRAGSGASATDLGFVGLLLSGDPDPGDFMQRVLGPVLDYDAHRGTDLIATLRAYFSARGSPVRAREELHVHVNTVVQRLDRITTLLGEGWQEPDRAVDMQLALRVLALVSR